MKEKEKVARPGRLELPTLCLEGRRSIQLSYGRTTGGCFSLRLLLSQSQRHDVAMHHRCKADCTILAVEPEWAERREFNVLAMRQQVQFRVRGSRWKCYRARRGRCASGSRRGRNISPA